MKAKKTIFLIIFIFFLVFPTDLMAWEDCPFGEVNDPAPGKCPRFIDMDNDSICDHSQPDPEERLAAVEKETTVNSKASSQEQNNKQTDKTNYYLPVTILLTLFLYFLSFGFVKLKKLKLIHHRKIWNLVLTVSFLITAVSSFLYLLGYFNRTLSLIHINIGILFIMVSFFHALWHIPYFKSYFK